MNAKLVQRTLGGLPVLELPGEPEQGAIVLLHGYGADASDLAPLHQIFKGPTWIFPQGPLSLSFGYNYTGRAWFPVHIDVLTEAIRKGKYEEIAEAFPPELDQARILVDQFLSSLPYPRSKIFLGGFSQGAILATETVLKSTEQTGGLIIFSGTLLNKLNWKRMAHEHAQTHFFQSHGTRDQLLPLQKAQELEKLLQQGGLKGELHVFEGGHEIPSTILLSLTQFLTQLIKH